MYPILTLLLAAACLAGALTPLQGLPFTQETTEAMADLLTTSVEDVLDPPTPTLRQAPKPPADVTTLGNVTTEMAEQLNKVLMVAVLRLYEYLVKDLFYNLIEGYEMAAVEHEESRRKRSPDSYAENPFYGEPILGVAEVHPPYDGYSDPLVYPAIPAEVRGYPNVVDTYGAPVDVGLATNVAVGLPEDLVYVKNVSELWDEFIVQPWFKAYEDILTLIPLSALLDLSTLDQYFDPSALSELKITKGNFIKVISTVFKVPKKQFKELGKFFEKLIITLPKHFLLAGRNMFDFLKYLKVYLVKEYPFLKWLKPKYGKKV